MAWHSLYHLGIDMEGRTIRFRKTFSNLPNLSHGFGINHKYEKTIEVPRGSIAKIYKVRGATFFAGFGTDMKTAPITYSSPASFPATIQLTIDDVHQLEIER